MTNVTIVGKVLEIAKRISGDESSIRMTVRAGPVKGMEIPCVIASKGVKLKDVAKGVMVSLTGSLARDKDKLVISVKTLEVLPYTI